MRSSAARGTVTSSWSGGWRALADPAAMRQTARGLREELEPSLHGIRVPTLLVRGAESRLVSPAAWARTKRAATGSAGDRGRGRRSLRARRGARPIAARDRGASGGAWEGRRLNASPRGIKWSAPVLIRRDGAELVVDDPEAGGRGAEGGAGRRPELHRAARRVGRRSGPSRRAPMRRSHDMDRDRAPAKKGGGRNDARDPGERRAARAARERLAPAREPDHGAPGLEGGARRRAAEGARSSGCSLAFYPAFAGRGRYAFAAKVSQLEPKDGKELFLQLHDALKRPEADADAGWKRVLVALGASERELADALANPSAEAVDLVDVIREHGLRSSPVAATVIAYMLERHLPRLWGRLADSLHAHYGVKEERGGLPAPRGGARERDRALGEAARRELCRPRAAVRGVRERAARRARRCGRGRC